MKPREKELLQITEYIFQMLVVFLREVIFLAITKYLIKKVKAHSSIGSRKSGQSSRKENK